MRRSLWISLLGIIGVAVVMFGAVLASGDHPLLGLDLRGGVSVVLQPNRKVPGSSLNKAVDIIRSRVDALGVAEPDISTQGSNIVISLPGVKDPQRALKLVGQTAELRFRTVLQSLPAGPPAKDLGDNPPPPPSPDESCKFTPDASGQVPTTPPAWDVPANCVVLADKNGSRYELDKTDVFGSVVKTATAVPPDITNGVADWTVTVNFSGEGGGKFKDLATADVNKQVAIVLDGVVQSAPTIQPNLISNFNNTAQITGQFTQGQAKDLATVLRFGSLPVQLTPQSTQTVSATLGKDSLRAGVIAGIVGLGLVLLYMMAYYRALGLVVVFGLCISGALLWSIVSLLGASRGLALTLAGATGIIVSVGVTVDSYIVYFERLKDEIRSGKTIRSSVDRGFSRAYRTILAADLVSFIAAALLYLLTVGSVRGFAFYLGLSTLLDLVTAYFFTRPAVILLGRSRLFTEARFFGIARGLAATRPAGATA